MNDRLGIGGNNPPDEMKMLEEEIKERHTEELSRKEDLIDAAKRIDDTTPEDALTTFSSQIKNCINALEKSRKEEKKPFDDKGKVVQGVFKKQIDALTSIKKDVDARITLILRKRAEEERQKRLEEERRKQEEAERLAKEAAELEEAGLRTAAEATIEKAVEAETQSRQAAKAATRTSVKSHGNYGSSAGLQGRWTAKITDISKLDLEALRPHLDRSSLQKALNSHMRVITKSLQKTDKAPQISGAVIEVEHSVVTRG